MRLTRRELLSAAASLLGSAAAGCKISRSPATSRIEGEIVGPSHRVGHLLRDGKFPPPSRTTRSEITVIGGGISGLSAGWKLKRSGVKNFTILELEEKFGGNSRWDENQAGRYPWGAHYIPFPSPDAKAVSELLVDLGVEIGRGRDGKPIYDDRYVCFAPTERIFVHGRWLEGLYPRLGATAEDLRQHQSFEDAMDAWREARDSEGRRAFAVPMEKSSRRPDWLKLDRISMAEFMLQNRWDSPRLLWFVEYALRDDFGSLLEDTSAWAGIHYFASRGSGDDGQVLTWPEGNGFVVRRLEENLSGHLRSSALVTRIEPTADGAAVDFFDVKTGISERLLSRAAVACLPQFAARRVMPSLRARPVAPGGDFSYSPWVVANLTVENPPDGLGAAPSWDNVLYRGESLGYIRATHQSLSQDRRFSVWTCYLPLTQGDESGARRQALEAPWEHWRDRILKDLNPAHPELAERVRRIDVMVWGHGMVKPKVGFVWGETRRKASQPLGRVFFGHSDLSGFSLFEEAQYRGLRAAEQALRELGRSFTSSLDSDLIRETGVQSRT